MTILRALFKDGALIEITEVDAGASVPSGFEARTIATALRPYIGGGWGAHEAQGVGPVTPDALDEFRAALLKRLPECRWAAQVRGVVIDGKRWHSDAEGRSSLVESAVLSAEWEAAHPDQPWQTAWKTADGFITVTRPELIAASFQVAAHVQGVFAREALLSAQIAEGDFEALAALAAEIEGGW